jgi:hypothetical protein
MAVELSEKMICSFKKTPEGVSSLLYSKMKSKYGDFNRKHIARIKMNCEQSLLCYAVYMKIEECNIIHK